MLKQKELKVRNTKPILKWAGGKTQLLPIISQYYPKSIGNGCRKYVEPFFGGGALFFELYNSKLIDEAIISDANPELILLYKTIKEQPEQLIEALYEIQKKYLSLSELEKKVFFYDVRTSFNWNRKDKYTSPFPLRAAQTIFINRTCFNGLFRVNKKYHYNVPHGNYKNPRILDIENIYEVSKAFQIAEILNMDFESVALLARGDSFVYYDPPYRPLSKTSNFNTYVGSFDDSAQIRLAEVFKKLHNHGISQMLSNSDPMSANNDDFFDELYQEFHITRVEAKRIINSNSAKRGKIFELLITNYAS